MREKLETYQEWRVNMSHLLDFYKEWKAWVDAGAPDGKFYRRDDSLCFAVECYEREKGLPRNCLGNLLRRDLRNAFKGNDFMPFNGKHNEQPEYWEECRDHKCHLNTMRVGWVDKMIEELSHAES